MRPRVRRTNSTRRASSPWPTPGRTPTDRKSTRLNSSHSQISYAVFCLKKKINVSKAIDVLVEQELGVERTGSRLSVELYAEVRSLAIAYALITAVGDVVEPGQTVSVKF